jgi:tetratricopeptide (TPR) repeat protein
MPVRRTAAPPRLISHWVLATGFGIAALAAGCSAPGGTVRGDSPAATDTQTPENAASCGAALPDLAEVGEGVQAQIRDRYAALPRPDARAGIPDELLAEAVGVMGMTFMAAWFTEEAEPCLREAAALAPEDVRWPYYLAQLYRDRGALEESATFFEQVLRIQPDDPTTLFWLGDIRLEQGRSEDAEPLFARALSLYPASFSARYGLAQTALLEEDYRRAADLLEEILAREPDIGAVHYPLGMAYRGLGNDAKAEEHLRRRENAEIRPADPLMAALDSLLDTAGTYETSGLAALDRQEWPAAIEQFRQGLELDPDNPGLRHRLGTALFMIGDLAGAMAEFERVVRSTPDYFPSHYSIGVVLQETGRHAEAAERFATALRHRPGDDAVRLRMAISLRHSGDPEASLSYYELVLRSNPDAVEARFGYVMALVQLGRYREAHDRLVTAMDAFPNETSFPHALARLLAATPDPAIRNGRRAMTLVERVMEAEPEPTLDLGETMAMTLAELGRFGEAAEVQRALIGAAELARMPDAVRRLTVNLRRYERGEPCRTPWSAGAMP